MQLRTGRNEAPLKISQTKKEWLFTARYRSKAIEHLKLQIEQDLFFTSPMALSRKDMATVKEMLSTTIDKVISYVEPSPSEDVACLNIDFFKY